MSPIYFHSLRQKELSRSQSLSKKAISKAAKQREATTSKSKVAKKGFCEFCSVKYSNLEKVNHCCRHLKYVLLALPVYSKVVEVRSKKKNAIDRVWFKVELIFNIKLDGVEAENKKNKLDK